MKKNHIVVTLVSAAALGLSMAWLARPTQSIAGQPAHAATAAAPANAPVSRATNVAETAPSSSAAARVERGKYLVSTSACHDCHTPLKMGANGPEPDFSRALSGHPEGTKLPAPPKGTEAWPVAAAATMTAWSGPWGMSFTANLTPDAETGLGAWTEDEFVRAIRSGRHRGRGRPILPPMPVPVYSNFTDEDLKSIFAYLRTIPAIKNRVPEPLPPKAG